MVENDQYSNLQVQYKSRPTSHALKGKSRGNDTAETAACVFVSIAWNGDAGDIKEAFAASATPSDGSPGYCVVYLEAK